MQVSLLSQLWQARHRPLGSGRTNDLLEVRYHHLVLAVPVAGAGGLAFPWDLAFGSDGMLYVTSPGFGDVPNSQVLRFNTKDGTFAGSFVANLLTRGMTFGGAEDDLYLTTLTDVRRYDHKTGQLIWTASTGGAGADHFHLAFSPGGDLLVSGFLENKILRFDAQSGGALPDFVTAGSGGLDHPIGFAFGPDGNLYVSSAGTDQTLRYDGKTGAFLGVFASGGGMAGPTYLTFDP